MNGVKRDARVEAREAIRTAPALMSNPSRGLTMLLILVTAYALAANGNDQDADLGPKGESQLVQAPHLLTKMKESRGLLRSGTYRATGRMLKRGKSLESETIQGQIKLFS